MPRTCGGSAQETSAALGEESKGGGCAGCTSVTPDSARARVRDRKDTKAAERVATAAGMRLLYVFPHPDDESFGPAAAVARQRRHGHEVFLLTLTRGGATKQRYRLGLTAAQMGEVRERELRAAGAVLGLSGQEVLDLPDGELAELDPRVIYGDIIVAADPLARAGDTIYFELFGEHHQPPLGDLEL